MKLLDMYDGHAIVQIHWSEMGPMVEALDVATDNEALATIQTFFEALMYAGRLQVKVGDLSGEATLRQFRLDHGIRDWQPHEVIYGRKPLQQDEAAD